MAQTKRPSAAQPAPKAPSRARGRPPKSAAEHEAMRRALLDATTAVFTREGYHGLSVELVLAQASLSRPTFYKYFRSVHAAIDVVLAELNDALVAGVLTAIAAADHPYAKVEAALLAFRRWCEQLGPTARALFAELHDAHSPASAHRARTQQRLARALVRESARLGRPKPSPLTVDAVIQGVEFLGFRHHLQSARNDKSWQSTRDAMLRLSFGLLATEAELEHAGAVLRGVGVFTAG